MECHIMLKDFSSDVFLYCLYKIYAPNFDLSGINAIFWAISVQKLAEKCGYEYLGKNLLMAERLSVMIVFYKIPQSNSSHSF